MQVSFETMDVNMANVLTIIRLDKYHGSITGGTTITVLEMILYQVIQDVLLMITL